jgi:hypothetical protein
LPLRRPQPPILNVAARDHAYLWIASARLANGYDTADRTTFRNITNQIKTWLHNGKTALDADGTTSYDTIDMDRFDALLTELREVQVIADEGEKANDSAKLLVWRLLLTIVIRLFGDDAFVKLTTPRADGTQRPVFYEARLRNYIKTYKDPTTGRKLVTDVLSYSIAPARLVNAFAVVGPLLAPDVLHGIAMFET